MKGSDFTVISSSFKLSSEIFFFRFLLGECFFVLSSDLSSSVSTYVKFSWNPGIFLKTKQNRPLEFFLCTHSVLAVTALLEQ